MRKIIISEFTTLDGVILFCFCSPYSASLFVNLQFWFSYNSKLKIISLKYPVLHNDLHL